MVVGHSDFLIITVKTNCSLGLGNLLQPLLMHLLIYELGKVAVVIISCGRKTKM